MTLLIFYQLVWFLALPFLAQSSEELFAVIGSACAETLTYGTSSITTSGSSTGYSNYLSTSVGSSPHTEWLQIVRSSDGSEVFSIYWTFDTPRTLEGHIATAVSTGVTVDYRVVEVGNADVVYTGATWRFSDSAGDMNLRFSYTGDNAGFSSDDGAWGAGATTVNGNSAAPSGFYGQGNWNTVDSPSCSYLYRNGVNLGGSVTSYMYVVSDGDGPFTAGPTGTPSEPPSAAPVQNSSQSPEELFAVIGSACAETLTYGTSSITTSGSSTGYSNYLSTSVGSSPHTEWLQIVRSSDGSEVFSIYWTFDTPRTLKRHIATAVSTGVTVDYRVVEVGNSDVVYTGATWRFSDSAGDMNLRFSYTGDNAGFSSDDGAWGAGATTVNGNSDAPSGFYGQGNWDTVDSPSCSYLYRNGVNLGGSVTSYMYVVLDGDEPPGGGGGSSSSGGGEDTAGIIAGVVIAIIVLIMCLVCLRQYLHKKKSIHVLAARAADRTHEVEMQEYSPGMANQAPLSVPAAGSPYDRRFSLDELYGTPDEFNSSAPAAYSGTQATTVVGNAVGSLDLFRARAAIARQQSSSSQRVAFADTVADVKEKVVVDDTCSRDSNVASVENRYSNFFDEPTAHANQYESIDDFPSDDPGFTASTSVIARAPVAIAISVDEDDDDDDSESAKFAESITDYAPPITITNDNNHNMYSNRSSQSSSSSSIAALDTHTHTYGAHGKDWIPPLRPVELPPLSSGSNGNRSHCGSTENDNYGIPPLRPIELAPLSSSSQGFGSSSPLVIQAPGAADRRRSGDFEGSDGFQDYERFRAPMMSLPPLTSSADIFGSSNGAEGANGAAPASDPSFNGGVNSRSDPYSLSHGKYSYSNTSSSYY